MLSTQLGVIESDSSKVWMRPETAQAMFVNFRNVLDTTRSKIPFGIAQIGKSFRNEITPGNFMFRVMEFYQMEIEFFCENTEDEGLKWFEHWKQESKKWREDEIGITPEKLTFRDHDKDELSFYSKGSCDVEYEFPYGYSEIEGIADRGTFDLDQHIEHSKKKLHYVDQENRGAKIIPAVIETSAGVDRTVLMIMTDSYWEDEENDRVVMRFSPKVAPFKVAVFPLFKKAGMPEVARKLYDDLRKHVATVYDDGGSIGKRYRRQDEIGTPFCITIDHESLEDNCVTLRDRDSLVQERVSMDKIVSMIIEKVNA
jgi:glycyl-tRNA synthetase